MQMNTNIQRTFHDAFGTYSPRRQDEWFESIARFMGIKKSRAEHLYREYTTPTGPEAILIGLYASGHISLTSTINHNLSRMERKYDAIKNRRA